MSSHSGVPRSWCAQTQHRQIVARAHPMGEMGHAVVHRPQCEQRVQAFWLVGSGSKAAATSAIALVMVDVVKIYDDTQAGMF